MCRGRSQVRSSGDFSEIRIFECGIRASERSANLDIGVAQPVATACNFMYISCMGLTVSNIHSLSDFQRNTRDHIKRLKKSGKPVVLTVNGEAEVVVQSAAAYQKLLDDRDLLDSIRSVSRGLEQAKRGEGVPMRQFLEALADEHRISLK